MPWFWEETSDFGKAGVWEIQEDERYFTNYFEPNEHLLLQAETIRHPAKRLQWLACRYALAQTVDEGNDLMVEKDESGRPWLLQRKEHISFSHTKKYAGYVISDSPVGMDLEELDRHFNPDVRHMFMNDTEKSAYERDWDAKIFLLIWSSKEAVFKLINQKGISFQREIHVDTEGARLGSTGNLTATFTRNGLIMPINIYYCFLSQNLLFTLATYTGATSSEFSLRTFGA